jgi:hypothetical protein
LRVVRLNQVFEFFDVQPRHWNQVMLLLVTPLLGRHYYSVK